MSEAPEVRKVLTFEIERDWDKSVVACHGRLVAGTTEEFYLALKRRVMQDKLVVIDMADLTYVDSMGLGTLVRLYVSARHEGCELQLLHLGKQMRNLVRLTNLTAVFASAEEHGITIA